MITTLMNATEETIGSGGLELPIAGEPPPERADAARNRRRILEVADRLFAEQGIDCTSMDAIAEAAGVGKGTLFRRFGDRAGLAYALLDENERKFQDSLLHGAPPLGPGAPAADRAVAFIEALGEHHERFLPLVLMAESGKPGARFRSPVYGSWHRHLMLLLAEAKPKIDAEAAAHLLLAPMAADLNVFLRQVVEMPADRIRAAQLELVRSVVA